MAKYERVLISVFTEDQADRNMYFKLFRMMLSKDIVESRMSNSEAQIKTDKVFIRFNIKSHSQRGQRAHYVLNLTQDEEFEALVAKPITSIHSYLKVDPNWEELFK